MFGEGIAHAFAPGAHPVIGIGVLRKHCKTTMPQADEIRGEVEKGLMVVHADAQRLAAFPIHERVDEGIRRCESNGCKS